MSSIKFGNSRNDLIVSTNGSLQAGGRWKKIGQMFLVPDKPNRKWGKPENKCVCVALATVTSSHQGKATCWRHDFKKRQISSSSRRTCGKPGLLKENF